MSRAILTITLGSFLLSVAIAALLTSLSFEPSNLTSVFGMLGASIFAGMNFVEKTGRHMTVGERFTCILVAFALMLTMAIPALLMVFAVGGLLTNPKTWVDMFGGGMGDTTSWAITGMIVYGLIAFVTVYAGLSASRWSIFKPAGPLLNDA